MKEYNGPSILFAVLVFGAIIIAPAFAAMEKVDEAELARTNASVTGTSIKERNTGVIPNYVTFDKTIQVISPLGSNASEGFSINLPSQVTETWTYDYGAFNPNYVGSLTGSRSR